MAQARDPALVESEVRLDWTGDSQGMLLLLVGAAVVVGALATFVFASGVARWPFGAVLLFVGIPLFRAGYRWPRSYATGEGLLRVRRGGRRLVAWADVEVIELEANQDPSVPDAVALMRVRLADGERLTIRVEPACLDQRAAVVREHCPHAFVDDRRSGEVIPPIGGSSEAGVRNAAVIAARAGRHHGAYAALWAVAAVIAASTAVGLFLSAVEHGGFRLWALCAMCVLGVVVAVRSVILRLALRSETRRP